MKRILGLPLLGAAVTLFGSSALAGFETEPGNSTQAGADALNVASLDAAVHLAALNPTDLDFFSQLLTTGEILGFMTTPLNTPFFNPDTIAGVFLPDGTLLISNDDAGLGVVGSGAVTNFGSLVRYRSGGTDTYSFAVTGFADFGFLGLHGQGGGYAITVSRLPAGNTVGGDFSDSDGSNEVYTGADSLNLTLNNAVVAVGNLGPPVGNIAGDLGDVDFYSVAMNVDEVLSAFTTPLGSQGSFSAPDTVLGVFDSAGNLIDSNDDAGTDAESAASTGPIYGSALRFQATAAGTYYIAVTGVDDDGFVGAHDERGLYALTASLVLGQNPVDIDCPPDLVVDSPCDPAIQDWLDSVTATSPCVPDGKGGDGGDPIIEITNNAPECGFPIGTTTVVTWTATDECGNSNTCTATITVRGTRASVSQKGSLLIYPKIELRWNAAGQLIQDTFVTLMNDNVQDVNVHLFFVNGDAPAPAIGGERAHPGWNNADNIITLTHDEPTYWSSATGLPKGVVPFSSIDGGALPGRPDPDNPGQRMLRGFLIAFAVNNVDHEIRWNHLSGGAMIVDYANSAAWEYGAYAFGGRCVPEGAELLDCIQEMNGEDGIAGKGPEPEGPCCIRYPIPGRLAMDGYQYDLAPGLLSLDFLATPSPAFSGGGQTLFVDTDLTLLAVNTDLRQDNDGPPITKVKFDIWNQNEVRFSNFEYCLTCWDERLFSRAQAAAHVLLANLQTNKGKARIDGLASVVCDDLGELNNPFDDQISRPTALLGVAARFLTRVPATPGAAAAPVEISGGPLVGQDYEQGLIQFDPLRQGDEARRGGLSAEGKRSIDNLRSEPAKPEMLTPGTQQSDRLGGPPRRDAG